MNKRRTFPIFLCLYIRQIPKPDGVNGCSYVKKEKRGNLYFRYSSAV